MIVLGKPVSIFPDHALDHLAAHQFGLRDRGHHAFPHQGAAKRPDTLDNIKGKSPCAMCRQEIRQKASVQNIDGNRSADDIGAAEAVVSFEQFGGADVTAVLMRFGNQLGNGRTVS